MNKTIIALAIAAALPVAAQADMTLSGSVSTKYKSTGAIDTDAALTVSSSAVLANGMTATATFGVLEDTDGDSANSGSASLAGDFGTLTMGHIDADGAFQSGDVAGVVPDTTESASSTASTVYGIHFSGSAAGLTIAAQVNAETGASGSSTITGTDEESGAQTKSTQIGATYNLDGLSVGYSYASDAADAENITDGTDGVTEGQSVFGVSYKFGENLVVHAGKQNLKTTATSPDALVSATYTMTADALTVVAQMDNTPSGDYQIDTTYAFTDAISLSSEIDSTTGKETTLVATYTMDDTVVSISKTDDGTTDASIALDYGTATLTAARNGGDAESSLTYKVSF
jgi:hypothetical protein